MKEIKYTIFYCVCERTFVIPFYYGSGSGTAIDNGSGSTKAIRDHQMGNNRVRRTFSCWAVEMFRTMDREK